MQYLLFACLIAAVLCWVMLAINIIATHYHVKPGMRFRAMLDIAVWWVPDTASYYLEDSGVEHFMRARTWLFRFLGTLLFTLIVLLVLGLQSPTP